MRALPLQAQPSLLRQALQAWEKDDLTQARACVDQATAEEAAPGKAWYYQGVIYEKLLRTQIATEEAPQLFEKTLAAYRQALSLTTIPSQYHGFAQINLDNLWAYYIDRGRRYYRQGNFERAIKQWQYCEQIRTDKTCVDLYMAIAAHQDEQYALARQRYTKYLAATKVAPAPVYRAMAHMTAEQDKKPQEGLKIIEAALLHYPFDHDLLAAQWALYQVMEKTADLQKLLAKKIAEAPSEAAHYYHLGYWYEQQEKPEEALKQYQKAAELAPRQLAPVRQQGLVHYNQAAQLIQKIQEIPDEEFQEKGADLKATLTHAWEQALPCLEKAHRLAPRDPITLKQLQNVYIRLKNPVRAAHLERKLRRYRIK